MRKGWENLPEPRESHHLADRRHYQRSCRALRVHLELPDSQVRVANKSDHDVSAPLMRWRTCVVFRIACGVEHSYLRGVCDCATEIADFGEHILHTILIQVHHSGGVNLVVCVFAPQHNEEFRAEILSTRCTTRLCIDGLVRRLLMI